MVMPRGGFAPPPPNMGYQPQQQPTDDWFTQNAPQGGDPTYTTQSLPPGYSMNPSTSPEGYPLSGFQAPGIAAPFTAGFNRPTPQSISGDPSYQFQLSQGLEAIQRSAASKGTLLTGGTLKDLTAFSQGLASSFDDKYWNRELGLYDRSYDIFRGNQAATGGLLSNLSSFGMQGAQGQAQAFGAGGMAQAGGTIGQANAVNAGIAAGANTLGEYLARRRGGGSAS